MFHTHFSQGRGQHRGQQAGTLWVVVVPAPALATTHSPCPISHSVLGSALACHPLLQQLKAVISPLLERDKKGEKWHLGCHKRLLLGCWPWQGWKMRRGARPGRKGMSPVPSQRDCHSALGGWPGRSMGSLRKMQRASTLRNRGLTWKPLEQSQRRLPGWRDSDRTADNCHWISSNL